MSNTEEKRIPDKVKWILTALAAIIAVVLLSVVIFQIVSTSKPENSSIIVYKKGISSVVRIGNLETTVSDADASNFKCDEESGRVFYTVDSSYSDRLYDLYYIEKNRSEIKGPKIIDIGVSQNYSVVSGKVYYLKKNAPAGVYEGCICDIDNNKIETFSDNVENIYALEGAEKLFFTKMHGDNRVLYEVSDSAQSEICRNVVNIFCYNDAENPHILYEKSSLINNGMSELYISYANGESEMICDNTYHVMFDEYDPDGNLYFFTSSSESISWSYVIADQYAESDLEVTKPDRKDFWAILGVSAEYNEAWREYQNKLVRDEIRAALNESVAEGEFSVPVFNAFVYNSKGTYKLAENIDPKNVYAVASSGAPKIVFENTEVLPADTDMNTLVEIAQRSTMADVIDYAKTIVDESVKSEGMAYAAYGSEGAVTYPLKGYDKSRTLFSFTRNGERLFAFVRDSQGSRLNLYSNTINENLKPSEGIGVDTGISSYRFTDGSVVYLKSDMNKISGDVFNYNGEKSVKLSNAASAFIVENYKDIIILKNHNSDISEQTADYYLCVDGEEKLIGNNIVVESFQYTESGKAAYITSDNNLWIYSGKESVCVGEDASEILLLA